MENKIDKKEYLLGLSSANEIIRLALNEKEVTCDTKTGKIKATPASGDHVLKIAYEHLDDIENGDLDCSESYSQGCKDGLQTVVGLLEKVGYKD